MSTSLVKVFIQQPVVPAYRVPFYDALAGIAGIDVELHASREVSGYPRSMELGDPSRVHWHSCKEFLAGRLFWQTDMLLPDSFGRGDVLVINSNPRFLHLIPLVIRARTRGVKVVAWNHLMSSTSGRISAAVRLVLTVLGCDLLLLYTDSEVQRFQRSFLGSRVALRALNNTLSEASILRGCQRWAQCGSSDGDWELVRSLRRQPPKSLTEFSSRHRIDQRTLLFCGRLQEKAQLSCLFQAMLLAETSCRLIVIGAGPSMEELHAEVMRLGLADRVSFLGEIYEEEELAGWFLSCGLFVYPGAIGLSLNHAMYYGLPVLTHSDRTRQMPEFDYIVDGDNGLLFEYGNPVSLAKVIDRALSEPSTLVALSEGALSTMWRRISFQAMVDKFISAIREVASTVTARGY